MGIERLKRQIEEPVRVCMGFGGEETWVDHLTQLVVQREDLEAVFALLAKLQQQVNRRCECGNLVDDPRNTLCGGCA